MESLAIHFHEAENQSEARRYYDEAIQVNPNRSQYHGRLAHILGQLGEIEAGQAEAIRSLEINPSLSQAHAWLAEVYQKQGDTAAAEKHSKIVEQFQSTQSSEPGANRNP